MAIYTVCTNVYVVQVFNVDIRAAALNEGIDFASFVFSIVGTVVGV